MSDETIYHFEWDPTKARSNLNKHGVSFEDAATVFLDAMALTVYDAASGQSEERWFTLGFDTKGKLVAVAHTFGDVSPGRARLRIISARRATRRERHIYEEQQR